MRSSPACCNERASFSSSEFASTSLKYSSEKRAISVGFASSIFTSEALEANKRFPRLKTVADLMVRIPDLDELPWAEGKFGGGVTTCSVAKP